MSATNSPAYCEIDDVQAAMQEADQSIGEGPLDTAFVESKIIAASRWLRDAADLHCYDPSASASDLISDSPRTTTDRQLDVPSSPHPQRGQIRYSDKHAGESIRYPVTAAGPYCKVILPKRHVESVDALRVRGRDGDTEDWVAASDKTEGEGEDYYLRVEGGGGGRSELYVRASSIGPRHDFDNLLEVDLTYGRDWTTDEWEDVRMGVAHVVAADLVTDDDILTQIPDNAVVTNVETQADRYLSIGMDRYLGQYMGAPVA